MLVLAKRLLLVANERLEVVEQLVHRRTHGVMLNNTGASCDRLGVRPLVARKAGKCRRERMTAVIAGQERGDRHDGRRVDTAAQRGADRHITAQAQADRVAQQVAKPLGRGGWIGRNGDLAGIPVAAHPQTAALPAREVCRRQALHIGKERRRQIGHRAERRETRHDTLVGNTDRGIGHAQRADFGGEQQPAVAGVKEQRLLRERVSRERQPPTLIVPNGEREHAVEAVERALIPLRPRMQQHLAVPFGLEAVTESPQLVAQLPVVVDLTVEDEVQRAQVQRLVRALVEIDDRQPPKRQPNRPVTPDALAVGATVHHRRRHPFEQCCVGGRPPNGPGDSTHAGSIRA